MAYLSLELLKAIEYLTNPLTHRAFRIKIGFHTGPAIGGVVGDQNLQYCLFGDAVEMVKSLTKMIFNRFS